MSESPLSAERELPNPQQTSDLLGRLQAFLPQLQAANQALSNDATATQVDLQLKEDDDSDESDNDEDDDEENDDGNENEGKTSASNKDDSANVDTPTIELSFAMGAVDENPIMKHLLEKGEEKNPKESALPEDETQARKRAIADMLQETTQPSLSMPADPSQTKKPLIMEINEDA